MDRIKNSRAMSFFAVGVIYVLAAAVGIAVYRCMPGAMWLRLLVADTAATVFTFVFSCIFRNASVYDPYWSVQPIFILWAFSFKRRVTFMTVLLLIAVTLWGVRLTANWAYTFGGLRFQDWRYTHFETTTGWLYPLVNFTGIHMVPTLTVYLCTLPAAVAIVEGARANALTAVFAAVSVCACALQCVSDIQMQAFRKEKSLGTEKANFIRRGLWKYSRHPNYLGEILMWWGIGLAAVSAMPDKLWLLAGAVANTVLFFAVSIPLADGRQSKKEGWDEYRSETRMLLPIKK